MRPIGWWAALLAVAALPAWAGRVPNGDFAAGLESWTATPDGAATVKDGAAELTVASGIGSLTGAAIPLQEGEDAVDWVLSCDLQSDAPVEKGSFGVSVYALDASGKRLKQIGLLSVGAKAKPLNQRSLKLIFGPSGAKPLPPGTAALQARFSFWNAEKDCSGSMRIDNVDLRSTLHSPSGRLFNGSFADGLDGWRKNPSSSRVEVKSDAAAPAVVLTAENSLCGLSSLPIALSGADAAATWELSCRLCGDAVGKGSFGVSVLAQNAAGKTLKQFTPYSLRAGKSQEERQRKFRFGAGTRYEFPAGTAQLVVRFSFWSADHQATGKMRVSEVAFAPVAHP